MSRRSRFKTKKPHDVYYYGFINGWNVYTARNKHKSRSFPFETEMSIWANGFRIDWKAVHYFRENVDKKDAQRFLDKYGISLGG